MRKWTASAALLVGLLTSTDSLFAQPFEVPAPAQSSGMRPIRLAKMVMKVRRGEVIGYGKSGLLCMYPKPIYWDTGGSLDLNTEEFDEVFRQEMQRSGYALAGDPSNLFEDSSAAGADYLVGGIITRAAMDICVPWPIEGAAATSKGNASVDVEWQIYSTLDRKVVGTVRTTGSAVIKKQSGGFWSILLQAFANAVDQLAANDRLRAALTGPPTDVSVGRKPPANLSPLQLKISPLAPASVSEAVASTVVVFTNLGEGSGFLIDADGYLLTNYHVVGDSQYVKVRWSDGSEALGEVIRRDKARDVALIKTDPKGHKPLRLRSQPATVGEDIYAIGAPTGAQFQFSVTKGIVSAMRVINGYNFIQGDVGVTHGNSGGPIVDGKGQVIGLTDLGREDAQMINLFIPIGEAQDFLGLQMAPLK